MIYTTMKSLKFLIKILFFSLIVVGCSPVEEVNVYTSRHYDVDDILYAEFTKKTGIKVNIISGSGGALMERLKAEGQNSPGDVFFTVDAGNLANFQKAGFLQPIESENIKNIIPVELRGPNNEWVAIAKRARVIFYNPESVAEILLQKMKLKIFRMRILARKLGKVEL